MVDRKVSKAAMMTSGRVDVGVVELDGGEHRRPGGKVDELRALVEKGGVVLIAFHDHVAAAPHPVIGLKVFAMPPTMNPVDPPKAKQSQDIRAVVVVLPGCGHHNGLPVATRKRFRASGRNKRGFGEHGLGLGVVPVDDVPHHH